MDLSALLLSIVTITYRDLAGLKITVDSLRPLLSRGAPAFEHLIVDSSPEDNRELISSLAASGWPLRHLTIPATGIYPALNVGQAAARGEVIWFLNGGDALASLEVLTELLSEFEQEPNLELLCAGAELVRDGQLLYPRLPGRTLARSVLGRNRLSHQAMLYRVGLLARVGPFETKYRIVGDHEHHLRCYFAGARARCSPRRLVRMDVSGASSNYRLSLRETRLLSRSLRTRLGLRHYLAQRLEAEAEALRVRVVKAVSESISGSALRPWWIRWNRARLALTRWR